MPGIKKTMVNLRCREDDGDIRLKEDVRWCCPVYVWYTDVGDARWISDAKKPLPVSGVRCCNAWLSEDGDVNHILTERG